MINSNYILNFKIYKKFKYLLLKIIIKLKSYKKF